jgi:peptidoglycan/LPS O-acetylase OafA/YrhL
MTCSPSLHLGEGHHPKGREHTAPYKIGRSRKTHPHALLVLGRLNHFHSMRSATLSPITIFPNKVWGGNLGEGRKFYVLDALRGVAALAVVQLHTSRFFGVQLFHHAGLAVDFFFMLSGFVLAFAYQPKLDGGWPTKTFLKVRLIRLYPLYLLGLLIGGAFILLRAHFGHSGQDISLGLVFLLGLFVLPVPPGLHSIQGAAFPLNSPTWSLFYEILANVFHALLLRKRSVFFLFVTAGISALALIFTVLRKGAIDCGFGQVDIYLGITRVLFSYTTGILTFFLWNARRVRSNISPFLPALLLVAALVGPLNVGPWYDLVSVIAVFPALLFLGASSTPSRSLVPVTHWMGVTSYAVYVLHSPLASFFELFWNRITGHNIELNAPWGGILYIVLILLSAVLIDRVYDLRVRAFLREKLA